MKARPASELPPPAFASLLWLTTVSAGSFLLAFIFWLNSKFDIDAILVMTLYASALAAFCSLPSLLLLPASLRWVFKIASQQWRWIRLLSAVGILFGLPAGGGIWFLLYNHLPVDIGTVIVLIPYLLAALLMAIIIYRPWLFRP